MNSALRPMVGDSGHLMKAARRFDHYFSSGYPGCKRSRTAELRPGYRVFIKEGEMREARYSQATRSLGTPGHLLAAILATDTRPPVSSSAIRIASLASRASTQPRAVPGASEDSRTVTFQVCMMRSLRELGYRMINNHQSRLTNGGNQP